MGETTRLAAMLTILLLAWTPVRAQDRLSYEEVSVRDVLSDIREGDVGAILGWGFAPFQGGALQFINAYGPNRFVARAEQLTAKYGARFAPPRSLLEMAKAGKTYTD